MKGREKLQADLDKAQSELTLLQEEYRQVLRRLVLVDEKKADTSQLEKIKGHILDRAQQLRSAERAILKAEQDSRPDPVPTLDPLSPRALELAEQLKASVAHVIEIGVPEISYTRMHEGTVSAPVLMSMFSHEELPVVTAFGDLCREFSVEVGYHVRTGPQLVPELVALWDRTLEEKFEPDPGHILRTKEATTA